MMILDAGNLKFKLTSAAFTRLSLSFIVAPARPTILNPGSPRTNVDSTSTGISASVKAAHFRDFISIFLLGFFEFFIKFFAFVVSDTLDEKMSVEVVHLVLDTDG